LSYGCFEAGKASHEKSEVKERNAVQESLKSGIAAKRHKKRKNLEEDHKVEE
jgi:hypothetical protein